MNNYVSKHRLFLRMLVIGAALFGASMLQSSTASAISNVLPDPADMSAGNATYLEVAKAGNGNQLEAPETWAKIYSRTPNARLIIEHGDHCQVGRVDTVDDAPTRFLVWNSTTTTEAIGASTVSREWPAAPSMGVYFSTDFADSTSCGNDVINLTEINASTIAGHQGWYVAFVYIAHLNPANGVNAFKLRVDSPNLIGYWDQGVGVDNPNPPSFGTYAFAIQDRVNAAASFSDFSFEFAPPCEMLTATTVYLRWQDADWGGIQTNTNYQTILREYDDSNNLTSTQTFLPRGGNNVYEQDSFVAQPNHRYEWDWLNVSKSNGVQIWLPFDSFDGDATVGSCAFLNDAPECAVGPTGGTYRVGVPDSMTRVNLRNDSSTTVSISSARYTIPAQHANSVINGQNNSGFTIPATSSGTIDANAFSIDLPSPVGSGYAGITWSVDWTNNGSSGTLTCPVDAIEITADPPVCSVTPITIEVGVPFRPSVSISNPNAAPIDVVRANYAIGTVASGNSATPAVPPSQSIAGPGTTLFEGGSTTITVAASHTYDWDVGTVMGVLSWPNSCASSTTQAFERPYFKVYGGGVSTGNYFGTGADVDACNSGSSILPTTADGHVYGWTRGSGSSISGSSVQYALLALGDVDGVYSASQRGTLPLPVTGLTFANTTGTFGGNYGNRGCISNYWRGSSRASVSGSSTLDLATVSDGDELIHSGDMRLTNTIGPDGSINASVYVDGDLFIADNIDNNNVSWTSRAEVGVLYIVTRGDVFINSSVNEVNAVLVALPRPDGSRGRIYTCRDVADASSAAYPGYAACDNRLVFNGSVIAREIHMGRVGGTVGTSTPQERSGPNIAEVFNFTPELFISRPAQPSLNTGAQRTDSIITLPPVL